MWDRVRGLWMEQALDTGVSLSGVRVSLSSVHTQSHHTDTLMHTLSVSL
jgi:hypothetical protein